MSIRWYLFLVIVYTFVHTVDIWYRFTVLIFWKDITWFTINHLRTFRWKTHSTTLTWTIHRLLSIDIIAFLQYLRTRLKFQLSLQLFRWVYESVTIFNIFFWLVRNSHLILFMERMWLRRFWECKKVVMRIKEGIILDSLVAYLWKILHIFGTDEWLLAILSFVPFIFAEWLILTGDIPFCKFFIKLSCVSFVPEVLINASELVDESMFFVLVRKFG